MQVNATPLRLTPTSLGTLTSSRLGPRLTAPMVDITSIQYPHLLSLISKHSSEGYQIFEGDIPVYTSPSFGCLTGYDYENEASQSIRSLVRRIHPSDRGVLHSLRTACQAGKPTFTSTYRYRHAAGHYIWRSDHVHIHYRIDGTVQQTYVICSDVSKQVEYEADLRATLDVLPDLLMEVDEDGNYSRVLEPHGGTLSFAQHDIVGRPMSYGLPRDAQAIFEAAVSTARENGVCPPVEYQIGSLWFSLAVSRKRSFCGTGPWRFLLLSRDITANKAAETSVKNLEYFDPLTGLLNRQVILDRIGYALLRTVRQKLSVGLMVIGLDDFHAVNSAIGQNAGDNMLALVASRLEGIIPHDALLARLGGDEFAVVFPELYGNDDAVASRLHRFSSKILQCFGKLFALERESYRLTPSVGISFSTSSQDTRSTLLQRANAALHQAKSAGKNCALFYDDAIQSLMVKRSLMLLELNEAILRGELDIHLQPIVKADRSVSGYEALVRWNHPVNGLIPPGEFIPLAEEGPAVIDIGRVVLRAGCAQLAKWAKNPFTEHLTLSVNVSAKQVVEDDFVSDVIAIMREFDVKPNRLELELTESLIQRDVNSTVAKMRELIAGGVGFSLDDFGTGYSSLSYLKRLPLSQVKIDRSFVTDLCTNRSDAVIAEMIIQLSYVLNISVVAEGVETEDQFAALKEMGCNHFQGMLFGRPLPAHQIKCVY